MKLLTKETDYTVRAILYLAMSPDTFVSSKVISEADNIPLQFLRGILQTLTREKIIISKEGASGGVKLIKDPYKIKLTELIDIFQGTIEFTECLFRKHLCHNREKCVLRRRIKNIEKVAINELESITIGSLIDDIKNS